ncbi:MAG TPA: hypothetical protein VKP60_15950 [Magnetospirillaceae bacterium]|nr:hypothetical protein [Magnetospirillaceae bacterium]
MSLSIGRIALLTGVVVVLALGAVDMHYGTISPCGIIKQKARDAAVKKGGFVAMIGAAVPDEVLDALIRARLGAETPDRCLMALLKGKSLVEDPQGRSPANQQ